MSATSTEEAAAPAPLPALPPEPQVRLGVAVAAVLATVVVALLVVALVVRAGADRLPTAAPRDPPDAPQAATRLTVVDRTISLDELSVTLPGAPYRCDTAVEPPPTGFSQLAACSFVVHDDYDGKGSDWGASAGVALVSDSLVSPDLAATTDAVFESTVSALYTAADRASVSKESSGPAEVPAPSGAARTRQADVRVKRLGLPTPYDRLVVIVVRLQSGQHVAYFSDFPHDGGKQGLQAVVASVGTLEAR